MYFLFWRRILVFFLQNFAKTVGNPLKHCSRGIPHTPPTGGPTSDPTTSPSVSPTSSPSVSPTSPSLSPTLSPTPSPPSLENKVPHSGAFLYIYIQIGIYYEEKQLIRVHKEQYLSYLKKTFKYKNFIKLIIQ